MVRRGSKRRSPTHVPVYPNAELTTAGARRAVWEGRAQMTRGGLSRDDLMVSNSTGKIVSKRASRASKVQFERNGLAPNANIAYKGAQYRAARRAPREEDGEEAPTDAQHMDWEQILRDA